jgi:hypothetical protein
MKELLFHGGPLKTEFFAGQSFWTWKLSQALEYAGEGGSSELWTVEIEKQNESIADEEDYLPEDGYASAENDDENWEIQTAAIESAIADGATIVLCDDGWVIVDVERLSPHRITRDEAEALYER